jgi:tether containing UBX domain for GLUT4
LPIYNAAKEDLPDSYFTPTAADIMGAQAALAARTQALINAPLQLRSQRQTAEKSKRDRWPNVCPVVGSLFGQLTFTSSKTTIRIRFSDRTQLEKIFPSTDKIRSVYAFVRSSLREDVKHIKFILCMAVSIQTKWAAQDPVYLRSTAKARPQGF